MPSTRVRFTFSFTHLILSTVNLNSENAHVTRSEGQLVPRLHTARQTTALSCQSGWECLEHPPHSPDLAPREFDLIGRLTKRLGSHRFLDVKQGQKAAPQWFRLQSPEFCVEGIQSQNVVTNDSTFKVTTRISSSLFCFFVKNVILTKIVLNKQKFTMNFLTFRLI